MLRNRSGKISFIAPQVRRCGFGSAVRNGRNQSLSTLRGATRDALTGAAADNNFQTEFRRRREAELPPWAHRERFNHFYRLAINTQLVNRGSGSIKVGDTIEIVD